MARLPTEGYNIDDYRRFARMARKELRTDPRQAVEKAYLAAVHAARQVIACSGMPWTKRRMSAAAIGRATQILGQRLPHEPRVQAITKAFALALGQHSACFYEGACDRTIATMTVKSVDRAARNVEWACMRLLGQRTR